MNAQRHICVCVCEMFDSVLKQSVAEMQVRL